MLLRFLKGAPSHSPKEISNQPVSKSIDWSQLTIYLYYRNPQFCPHYRVYIIGSTVQAPEPSALNLNLQLDIDLYFTYLKFEALDIKAMCKKSLHVSIGHPLQRHWTFRVFSRQPFGNAYLMNRGLPWNLGNLVEYGFPVQEQFDNLPVAF